MTKLLLLLPMIPKNMIEDIKLNHLRLYQQESISNVASSYKKPAPRRGGQSLQ